MKTKSTPHQIKSGNYLEQGCLEGLTAEGKKYAKEQIKKFKNLPFAVPYGIIRTEALKK